MKHPWIAITQPCPDGFVFQEELSAKDVRRYAFALFAASVEQADEVLQPYRGKVTGLVISPGDSLKWEARGEGIFYLTLPPDSEADLHGRIDPLLSLLQRVMDMSDVLVQRGRDLTRAAEDRARLVHEFSDMRDGLLKEIAERRSAQEELQKAHDELEIRVQERTAELADANASLKLAWSDLTRSHRELMSAHSELEADLELAREFQVALLPHHHPEFTWGGKGASRSIRLFHFYEPSGAVGGDFFHLLHFSDKKTGLFFCDVMGHGVRSALMTAILLGLIEEVKGIGPNPGRLLTAVNKGLSEVLTTSGETLFASAFLLVVDLERLELTYSNAGHPHPFLVKPAQQGVEFLPFLEDSSGPALGLIPDATFKTLRCPAALGDSVVIFTDGIFEVTNEDDEEFGLRRLQHTLESLITASIPDLLGRVVERSRKFSAQGVFDDDVCLVALQLSGEK